MPGPRPAPPSHATTGDTLSPQAAGEVAALFAEAVETHRTAGVTWAVIGGHRHDRPVLATGSAGAHHLQDGDAVPGSPLMSRTSISRIASMTKSFTAATILALRDEGRLRLDDPVAQHLPEAAALFPGTQHPLLEDAPVLTIRHLLTMSAGLVTDNPWGDRQEAMTQAEFAQVLAEGLGVVHTPGTGFEYSNTGYALLGRIIDELSRAPYQQVIAERFLRPLGMEDTAFSRDDLSPQRVAIGHRLADREDRTRFEAEPFDSPGVYGAMAGLYSSVDDVVAWVRFLAAADADPALRTDDEVHAVRRGRTASGIPHAELLSSASRREMCQAHRLQVTPELPAGEDGVSPGFDRVRAYGMGLVVERFADLGEIISHSGGYPGYGSFMAWHRGSGVGIVALANSKYAPAVQLSMTALRSLHRSSPELFAAPPASAEETTLAAADGVLHWLRTEDPAAADAWFADSMDLDQPREERLRRRDAALLSTGLPASALHTIGVADAQVITRAHLRWEIPAGPHGEEGISSLRIDLDMDPRRASKVQGLTLAARRA